MIKAVIFDLDGTIADTSPGIFGSYRHIARMLGKDEPDDTYLKGFVGGGLPDNMKRLYSLNDEDVPGIVNEYRRYYAEHGISMCRLYDGFTDVVNTLHPHGLKLGVATLKLESFAHTLMEQWNLTDRFDCIYGTDDDDTLSKSDIIRKNLVTMGCEASEAVMVGDSISDMNGSKEAGTRFVGAAYGFALPEEMCQKLSIEYISDVRDLPERILG